MLDWDKSGWPDKAIFEPLFQAAIEAKLPILPGEPAPDRVDELCCRAAERIGDRGQVVTGIRRGPAVAECVGHLRYLP